MSQRTLDMMRDGVRERWSETRGSSDYVGVDAAIVADAVVASFDTATPEMVRVLQQLAQEMIEEEAAAEAAALAADEVAEQLAARIVAALAPFVERCAVVYGKAHPHGGINAVRKEFETAAYRCRLGTTSDLEPIARNAIERVLDAMTFSGGTDDN